MPEILCHCGKPLHYSTPWIRDVVEKLIAQHGEYCNITVLFPSGERTFKVQRHYIALHGVKSVELPDLGFEEIPGANGGGPTAEPGSPRSKKGQTHEN